MLMPNIPLWNHEVDPGARSLARSCSSLLPRAEALCAGGGGYLQCGEMLLCEVWENRPVLAAPPSAELRRGEHCLCLAPVRGWVLSWTAPNTNYNGGKRKFGL